MPAPSSPSASALTPVRLACAVVALIVAGLFLICPYQHWHFGVRMSVLGGWWRWVGEHSEEWFFCPYVPLVSGWFVWQRRKELQRLPLRGHGSGLLLLLLALFLFWVGYRADTAYPGFAALQLMLAGLVLWLCGKAWMRVLLFPWLFLIFMWPIYPLEDQVAVPLRMATAGASSEVLNLIGVANVNEGTSIRSAADVALNLAVGDKFKLDVEVPCSGIRSLYSLAMLAALYGYVFLRGWWPRLTLFASAVPLAVLGNIVRMVMLGLGCVWFGTETAIGRQVNGREEVSLYHLLAGYAVFAVALIGMFALASLLERRHWKKIGKASAAGSDALDQSSQPAEMGPLIRRCVLASGLAVVTVLLALQVSSQPPLSEPGVAMPLPSKYHGVVGIELPISQREQDALDADITLSRYAYMDKNNTVPKLAYVVLSGSARRGLHRPDVCLVAQGWTMVDRSELPIRFSDGREVTAMLLRLVRDTINPATGQLRHERAINVFWYQGLGKATGSYYEHLFITYFDSVFRNLNHRWALVSFFSQLPDTAAGSFADPMAEATGLLDLQEFIRDYAPEVIKK